MTKRFDVQTNSRDEFIDLSAHVQELVTAGGVADGLCTVFVPHTTAAVTIQENADPDVGRDIIVALNRLCPDRELGDYRHIEENAPGHVKVALIGSSIAVPILEGKLTLGTWQAIFLCEFDGPRKRNVIVNIS